MWPRIVSLFETASKARKLGNSGQSQLNLCFQSQFPDAVEKSYLTSEMVLLELFQIRGHWVDFRAADRANRLWQECASTPQVQRSRIETNKHQFWQVVQKCMISAIDSRDSEEVLTLTKALRENRVAFCGFPLRFPDHLVRPQ